MLGGSRKHVTLLLHHLYPSLTKDSLSLGSLWHPSGVGWLNVAARDEQEPPKRSVQSGVHGPPPGQGGGPRQFVNKPIVAIAPRYAWRQQNVKVARTPGVGTGHDTPPTLEAMVEWLNGNCPSLSVTELARAQRHLERLVKTISDGPLGKEGCQLVKDQLFRRLNEASGSDLVAILRSWFNLGYLLDLREREKVANYLVGSPGLLENLTGGELAGGLLFLADPPDLSGFEFWQQAAQIVQKRASFLHGGALTILLDCFGRVGYNSPQFVRHISQALLQKVDQIHLSQLESTVRAIVRCGRRDVVLLNALAARGLRDIRDMEPRWIASLCWCLAMFDHQHEEFLSAALEHCRTHKALYCGRDKALLMWSVAKLKYPWKDFAMDYIPDLIQSLSHTTLGSIHASQVMVAWAWSGYYDKKFFDWVGGYAVHSAAGFTSQELLGHMLWAFAVAGHYHQGLVETCSAKLRQKGPLLGPYHLALCLGSLATLRCYQRDTLDAAAKYLARKKDECWMPLDVVQVAYAYAYLNHCHPEVNKFLTQQLERNVAVWDLRHLATLCWALSVLGWRNAKMVRRVASRGLEEMRGHLHDRVVCDMLLYSLKLHSCPGSIGEGAQPSVQGVGTQQTSSGNLCFPSGGGELSCPGPEVEQGLSSGPLGPDSSGDIAQRPTRNRSRPTVDGEDCHDAIARIEQYLRGLLLEAFQHDKFGDEFHEVLRPSGPDVKPESQEVASVNQSGKRPFRPAPRRRHLPDVPQLIEQLLTFRGTLPQENTPQNGISLGQRLGQHLVDLGPILIDPCLADGLVTADLLVEWRGRQVVVLIENRKRVARGGPPGHMLGTTSSQVDVLRSEGHPVMYVPLEDLPDDLEDDLSGNREVRDKLISYFTARLDSAVCDVADLSLGTSGEEGHLDVQHVS